MAAMPPERSPAASTFMVVEPPENPTFSTKKEKYGGAGQSLAGKRRDLVQLSRSK